MRRILLVTALLLLAPAAPAIETVALEHVTLIQKQEVRIQHQRLVGNVRAQARREGVVVNLPQLYVYLTDYSASWHMDGFRDGFERELTMVVTRNRQARSMVRLDRLLERVTTRDGQEITQQELPTGDFYVLLYRRADCEDCERVENALTEWMRSLTDLQGVWIDVWMDRRPE